MAKEYEWLWTLGLTLLGSGLGTTLVGAWFKKHFDAELERRKALLQRELETQKATLQRGSRVHERQTDALLEMYSKLERAHFLLQRATSAILFAGETQDALIEGTVTELQAAARLYSERKLLFPISLVAKFEQMFEAFHRARIDLGFATWDMTPPGDERAKLWRKAQEMAFQQLPPLLAAIEAEARRTIHSG